MIKQRAILSTLFWAILLLAACSNTVWDQLPSTVSDFVMEYYPGADIKAYTVGNDGSQTVTIKNGASITFDSEHQWVEINGEGSTLPEVMVNDQLPAPLYSYLEELIAEKDVYKITRTPRKYTVTLSDSVIDYDISTGKISYASSL